MFNIRLLFAAMTFGRFGNKPSVTPAAERRAERQVSGMARARYIRSRSRYVPHQGRRECERRMMGGFAGVANTAEITKTTRERVIARCLACNVI